MNTWFIKLLDVVRSEWRVRVEERLPDLTPSEASEFAHTLEVIAEDCAYLSTYIAERAGATGCGEATHEEAAKEAYKVTRRVSKALGFTFPDRRISKL